MKHLHAERRTLGSAMGKGTSPLVPAHYEYRAPVEIQSDGNTIFGYAAVFNSLSQDLGGFREIIKPGAFTKTLADGLEKFGLWAHETRLVLGALSNNTLLLREDAKGLYWEAKLPSTSYASDVRELLKGKYISKCSFGFRCHPEGSTWFEDEKGVVTRTLTSVQLFEVSVLGDPAYTDTEADCRTAKAEFDKFRKKDLDPAMRMRLLQISL